MNPIHDTNDCRLSKNFSLGMLQSFRITLSNPTPIRLAGTVTYTVPLVSVA